MKKFKVIHLNLELEHHNKISERAKELGMPVATLAKALVMDSLSKDSFTPEEKKEVYIRKPRIIKN